MKMVDYSQIQKYVKTHYSGFSHIQSIKLLEHNHINSINYVINSKNKKYILHNFIDGSPPTKIEKICKILFFCHKNGVRVVKPILNKQNYFVDPERNFYFTKYYSGKLSDGNNFQFYDLAKNLAVLHDTLSKNTIFYNYRTNQKFYRIISEHELSKIKKIILKKKKPTKFEKIVFKKIQNLIQFCIVDKTLSKNFSSSNFHKQLIHDDLHPGNVIFNKNNVGTILDFQSMRKGFKIEDISFCSFRFAAYKTYSTEKITNQILKFLDIYQKYGEIDKEELSHFYYFLNHKLLGRLSYILRKSFFF